MAEVWVQALTAPELLRLLLGGRRPIRYDPRRCTRAAGFLLRRLRPAGVDPADIDFNRKDESGEGLLYRMQADLEACLDEAVARHAGGETERAQAALRYYLREKLEWPFVFVTAAARQAPAGSVFRVAPHPFNELLLAHYARRGVPVEQSFGGLAEALRSALSPLAFVGAMLAGRLAGSPASELGRRDAVWVEYYHDVIFERAFWHKDAAAAGFEHVYYFDRADTPFTAKARERVRRLGMSPLDLGPMRLIRHAAPPAGETLAAAWQALAGPGPWWLRSFRLQAAAWRAVFERVYRRFRVRLLFQHQDRSWKQALQADAVEAAGGVMAGYHWSNLPYAMPNWFLTAQHVYFVWGSASREAVEKMGGPVRHVVPSGVWLGPDARRPAALDRLAPSTTFKLALFDSDVSYYGWQSPATLSLFLSRLFALIDQNPGWAGLVKSKFRELGQYGCLPDGRRLAALAKRLEGEGRLVILEPGTSPINASLEADLSVCYAFTTPGLLAASYGKRAVHWDCVGLRHPMMKDPSQRVLYSSLDELCGAIAAFARGDRSIGDFGPWLSRLDWRADHRGAERIAWFVRRFMKDVPEGRAVEHLDAVVKEYLEREDVEPGFFSERFGL